MYCSFLFSFLLLHYCIFHFRQQWKNSTSGICNDSTWKHLIGHDYLHWMFTISESISICLQYWLSLFVSGLPLWPHEEKVPSYDIFTTFVCFHNFSKCQLWKLHLCEIWSGTDKRNKQPVKSFRHSPSFYLCEIAIIVSDHYIYKCFLYNNLIITEMIVSACCIAFVLVKWWLSIPDKYSFQETYPFN